MKKQIVIDKLKLDSRGLKLSDNLIKELGLIIGCLAVFLFGFFAGINPVVPVFLICLSVYLKFLYRDLARKPFCLLNLTLLFLIIVSISYFILLFSSDKSYLYIPFCILPMLTTLLFNELAVSLVITVACAVTVAFLYRQPYYLAVLFLISGLLSSILVYGDRKGIAVLKSGVIIGLVQALVLFFIEHFSFASPGLYLILLLNGIASGIIVIGVLPVFEYLFGTITNIKLLELTHHPILNRLMMEAPGTFHHSLVVGNLSEAACKAIGANSLLGRIGAYYHDIGKLSKPGYFTENQNINSNAHGSLVPDMSKLVIMNHINEGVDLAKRYHLNPRLIDFIRQHHGTSLVYFFYRRALESSTDDQGVAEERFRYPGPKPNTKETAIVLLADSVEAATRAIKDPGSSQIDDLVHKIINNKFIDGQLDECDLTLKDLETISTVFIHILSGIYHTRVNYPEADVGYNHKKYSKENSDPSEKDKKHNP